MTDAKEFGNINMDEVKELEKSLEPEKPDAKPKPEDKKKK